MKIALITSTEFIEVFRKLLDKPLPLKTAFKLRGTLKILEEKNALFNETKAALIRSLAEKDERGVVKNDEKGNITIAAENREKFMQELMPLLQEEVEVTKVKIDDLGDIPLTVQELALLDDLIEA